MRRVQMLQVRTYTAAIPFRGHTLLPKHELAVIPRSIHFQIEETRMEILKSGMDRRSFAALLPALLAAPGLMSGPALMAESHAPVSGAATETSAASPPPLSDQASSASPAGGLAELKSNDFPAFTPPEHIDGHASKRFFLGMLPGSDGDNIRFESHITYLAPNAPHEPVEKHKHSEMWLVREGTIELNLNGVAHLLEAGQVGLCVAGDMHYVKNAGPGRASYFVVSVGPPE